MPKMPLRAHQQTVPSAIPAARAGGQGSDWRSGLPQLTGSMTIVRDLTLGDAQSLFVSLSTEEVARYISPPPTSVPGFERFIAWTAEQRAAGQYACFGIVPRGLDAAVGLFQVRSLESDFGLAEWGFALAAEHWGTGVFVDGAQVVMGFGFDVLGINRLEARAAVRNGRGNGALRKIGALQEGVLRRSFLRNGEYLDQALWSILREDWQRRNDAVSVLH